MSPCSIAGAGVGRPPPTMRHAPRLPNHPPRGLAAARSLALAVVVALTGVVSSANGVAATPFMPVIEALIERFHAEPRPCDMAIGQGHVCFVVRPGQVALLAASLEAFVGDQGGAIERGAWTSANGAHRVVLTLEDGAWGSLELWLAERPDRSVEGWFERWPRRRD